jgi:hypothetical protein
MWLVKILGFNFAGFLFAVILGYYFAIGICLRWLLKKSNVVILFISFCILSFWLVPLVLVAFRQGVGLLFIILAFNSYRANSTNITAFVFFVLAPLMHLSIMLLSIIALSKSLILSFRSLIDITFLIVSVVYIFSGFTYFNPETVSSFFDDTSFLRALMVETGHYNIGPTLLKALASIGPLFLIRLISFFRGWNSRIRSLYYICVSISVVGMVMSGFPYHDRILLNSWCLTSLLIASSIWLIFTPKRDIVELKN